MSGSAPRNNTTMDVLFPQPYNAVLAIVSSSLSVFGALALIATYFFWKSNRTISRFIVACIAASDFLTASGYIVMSSYLLWLQNRRDILGSGVSLEDVLSSDSFSTLRRLCTAQSFVTTTSSNWSFWWTAILAFHLYLILVHMQWTLAKRLVWAYVVIATVVPLVYTIPALATGWLGVGCFSATTTWCFVGIKPVQEPHVNLTCASPGVTYKVLEAVEGKVWEVMAFFTILVLYLSIWCTMVKIRAQVRCCATPPPHCATPPPHYTTPSTSLDYTFHLTAPHPPPHCTTPSTSLHHTPTSLHHSLYLTAPHPPPHCATPSTSLHHTPTSLHHSLHLTAPHLPSHCTAPSTSLHHTLHLTAPHPPHYPSPLCAHPLSGARRGMPCYTMT